MKITDIEYKVFELKLISPVKVAIGEITHGETVVVRISTDNGLYGFGEGSGIPFVTGEDCNSVINALDMLKSSLVGRDPWAIENIHHAMDVALMHNTSAKAAIDLALYDLMGKSAGLPLYKLLGGARDEMETDKTIGIDTPEAMAQQALILKQRGFKQIKVKAGLSTQDDIQAIRMIREKVGWDIGIKVDANQGWSVSQAIQTIDAMKAYGVDAVEQPVPYWDIDGLAYIRSRTSLPLMADESCFSIHDAMNLVKREAVDIINIKLMKSGGLYKALKINAIAQAAGIGCMLGCMMESRIGIAAGAALVAAQDNFIYGDLDSTMFFEEHDGIRGGFSQEGPVYKLGQGHGLGVEVDF